jgi:pimeloyl-ACP methyl ester carboxylesterase
LVNGRLRQTTKRDVEEYWAPTQFPEFTLAMRHLLHEFTWDASFIPPDVPSLLMCGTRDRFLSGAGLSRLRRMMPKMRCLEIENAGHVVCDEAPAIVNQELLDFFEKLI